MRGPAWERRYSRKILTTDSIVVFGSIFAAQFIRYGTALQELEIPVEGVREFTINYSSLSLFIAVMWLVVLGVQGSRDPKVFGIGPTEYKRIINSTLLTFGATAIVAFAFRWQIGRGYMFIALPLGLFLLILTRWLWRKRLHHQRKRHRNIYRTLIVGERSKSAQLAQEISTNRYAGFGLLGAVTERGTSEELVPGLPVVGSYDDIIDVVDRLGVGTLILTTADTLTPDRVKRISWQLESRHVDLIVAAGLTDIAGPRVHMRPVSGFPLIHIEFPKFEGKRYFAKRFFDLVGSSALLLLLSPLLLVLSIIVKLDSPGPILFFQERVGSNGRNFKMWKFRSMVANAEDQLPGLLDATEGNGVLFKMKNDPRITRSGRTMRKFSLDELPQLVNVFKGDMSLVGPRPPLPREVAHYDEWAHRRLLVKPGITGLWQVSGRSDLSWEDSIRLDLYYVENWSMTGDLLILWRTVRTVVSPEGAY